jgi:hypothetical protein
MLEMNIRMSQSDAHQAARVAQAVAASAQAIAAVPQAPASSPKSVKTFFSRAKNAMKTAKSALKRAGRYLTQKARNAHNYVLGGRVVQNLPDHLGGLVSIKRTRLGNALNMAKGYGSRALSAARKYGKAAYNRFMNRKEGGKTRFGRAYSATKRFLSRKARNAHNYVLGGREFVGNRGIHQHINRTRLGQALNKARNYRNRAYSAAKKYGKAAYNRFMNRNEGGKTRFGRAYSALKRFGRGIKSRFTTRKVLSSTPPPGEQVNHGALFEGSRQNAQ